MSEAEDEQVVGVLKYCDVCEERTVHVDGVCRDHKVVRRRRAVAADAQPRAAVAPRRTGTKRQKPKSRVGTVIALLVIIAVVYAMGAIHVVHSGAKGYSWCRKTGWSLSHTLVDLDDPRSLDANVIAALAKCNA